MAAMVAAPPPFVGGTPARYLGPLAFPASWKDGIDAWFSGGKRDPFQLSRADFPWISLPGERNEKIFNAYRRTRSWTSVYQASA